MTDLYTQLEVLSHKFLGETAWFQMSARAVCDALLAKAFVEQWPRDGREAYFLVRAHAQLQLGSDQGQT